MLAPSLWYGVRANSWILHDDSKVLAEGERRNKDNISEYEIRSVNMKDIER